MSQYHLNRLSSPQFTELLVTARVALIPFGATEQHGSHLAMGTDAVIAETLAARIAERCAGLAFVTPAISVGFSLHHRSFPGTLSARTTTAAAQLEDMIVSLRAHGVQRFLVINGHGGNLAFLPAWAAEAQEELNVRIAIAHWSLLGRDVVTRIAQSPITGHACEVETSLALAIAPELVVDELPTEAPLTDAEHPLIKGQAIPERDVGIFLPRRFEEITVSGALGNPSAANVEAGNELAEAVVTRGTEFVTWLAGS